jgi:hypothetical protein
MIAVCSIGFFVGLTLIFGDSISGFFFLLFSISTKRIKAAVNSFRLPF